MNDLERLSANATASGRRMAVELGAGIGVKRLCEIWEQHQADIQAYIIALNAAHIEAGSTMDVPNPKQST